MNSDSKGRATLEDNHIRDYELGQERKWQIVTYLSYYRHRNQDFSGPVWSHEEEMINA